MPPRDEAPRISPGGARRLKAITLYIAEDNPDRAITFVEELRAKAQLALERPQSFPARDDLAPGLRVARHGRYPLFFHKIADEIQIVRVMHGARDLAQIFNL